MKISIHWLREFVDFDLEPAALADMLTALGLEATVPRRDYGFEGVVVGKITSVKALPESDHLSVCEVDVGRDILTIVCGAPNVEEGAWVPVAVEGARLPGGATIEATQRGGQLSQGIICAEDELGLSEDHSGIMVLKGQADQGQDFKDYLNASTETLLDLDLTPNRGDALSHWGVARDLAAKLDTAVKLPEVEFTEGSTPVTELARVDISAPEGCHRYAARVITGVEVGPSPEWLVRRLEGLGLRSINNVVDASNYVLLELGHPLHIFDRDRLVDHRIDVYFAKKGQKFTTLDGQERGLSDHHLLIADGKGPVALAGIMGGLGSEVTEKTTDLLIESAYFAPAVIRRGAKSLDLSTEASRRFERDTDIEGLVLALDRVTSLIVSLAGGTVAKGRIDVHPKPHLPREIELSVAFTNRLLGTTLSSRELTDLLRRLGIQVAGEEGDLLRCSAPLSRPELTEPVDLIEEAARLLGYDNIAAVEGVDISFQGLLQDTQAPFSRVRAALSSWGFHEHVANTLVNGETTSQFSDAEAVELENPLSAELAYLRTSLIPGLLQAAAFNERRRRQDIQLFEIGTVHQADKQAYNLTRENFMLGLVATVGPGTEPVHWKKPPGRDLYFLKGVAAQLLKALGVPEVSFHRAESRGLAPALTVASRGRPLGVLGEVRQAVELLDISAATRLVAAELDLVRLLEYAGDGATVYRDVVPYPVVERDVALEVPARVPAVDLLATIRDEGGKYLLDARVFDLYSGRGVGKENKSLAFRLYFQSSERTLTDDEVDEQVQRVAKALQHQQGAKWRKS